MTQGSVSYELVRAYAPGSGAEARIVRASLAARTLGRQTAELAALKVPVLIVGETGTGKTLVAQALCSAREGGQRTTINCASLSDAQLAQFVLDDLQAEERANGSLFLDEIAELSTWGQAVLLRALSDRDPSCGPRLLAATSCDLDALVRAGSFSAELLMRLRGVTLALPPLRERREEIGPLALHFVRLTLMSTGLQVISIDPRVVLALEHHSWPGNVRELRNAISSALTGCSDGYLHVDCLSDALRRTHAAARD